MITQGEYLQSDFYKSLLDNLFDAVLTVDRAGRVTYWNQSCTRLTGFGPEEMVGLAYPQTPFARTQGSEQGTGSILMVLESGMPGTWKGEMQRKNGAPIPVQSQIAPIRREDGQIAGAVEVIREISAHVALEKAHEELLRLSRLDQLTGLLNRAAISEHIKAEIERSRRYSQPLSVVMIDIDFFKRINDKYGHDQGDQVLRTIGAILTQNVRKPDIVGRWGGEEFLTVAPGSGAAGAAILAERLRGCIEAIPAGQIPEPVTASFGVAQLQSDQSPDQLLYVADMALYQAKRGGRNRVVAG